jgi:hypothetical protein
MVHLRPKVGSAMLASLSLEGRLVPTLVSVRARPRVHASPTPRFVQDSLSQAIFDAPMIFRFPPKISEMVGKYRPGYCLYVVAFV